MPPVVDLGRSSGAREVADSLRNSGFAVITNHPIPLPGFRELFDAWGSFFRSSRKTDYPADASSQAGYFSPEQAETAIGSPDRDLKEYFQYWPDTALPPETRKLTIRIFDQMFSLAGDILSSLERQTSASLWQRLPTPLGHCLSRSDTMLRILRYPPLRGDEPRNAIRASAHEDINFITLLPAASEAGLEIRPRGQDWQPVEAPEGAIIINIGDMLQELTDGVLPSTTHRVVNPRPGTAHRARLTAPLFCHPEPDLVLSDRYTAGEYLTERLNEINPEALRPR